VPSGATAVLLKPYDVERMLALMHQACTSPTANAPDEPEPAAS
jgi:hypothetical protein